MELRLNSPAGGAPAIYRWPLNQKKGYDEAQEIVETITWGCKDIPDLKVALTRNILREYDVSDYDSMKALTKRYNTAINNLLRLEKGTQKFCDRLNQLASRDLLRHIMQQTYSSAVTDAEKLNRYQAFSPDVYGETSFELVAQMIDQINLTKDDVFIDLGSGVGQVVLQVAATSLCKSCVGIERAEVPTVYAKAMETKFRFWMQWYGKKCGPFQLLEGDFFDERFRDKFAEATVIFVNNFAFGPSVDHKLKLRFADLKQGTKIVSSKRFCPLNFRITDRNLSDIGTIMNISEISPSTSSVSWTDKPVSYYLHEIDRTKLENYYFRSKKNQEEETATSCNNIDTQVDIIMPPPKKRKRFHQVRTNNKTCNGDTGDLDKPENMIPNQDSKPANTDTRYNNTEPALKHLLETLEHQYKHAVEEMSAPTYKYKVRQKLDEELKRRSLLKLRIREIEEDIENIIVDMTNYLLKK